MTPQLIVVGYGAVTAVGFDAAQTCAAIRAGVSGFRKSGFFLRRKRVTALIGAEVPYEIPAHDDDPANRLARMASDVVNECLGYGQLTTARTAILLGVRQSTALPPAEAPRRPALLSTIAEICGTTFHPASAEIASGSCAIATGLLEAARLLDAGTVDACIVGGVDSYLTHEEIEYYGRLWRLKTPENSRGFIPGEAAAAVAVTVERLSTGAVTILGAGVALEDQSRTVLSDGYPTGSAVTEALNAAARDAGIDERSLEFRVAGLNGEVYSAQDWILGAHRFYRTLRPDLPLVLPAACVGETGAAAGALGVVVAALAMVRGYAPGPLAMCEAASDEGLRSGVVLAVRGNHRMATTQR